MLELKVGAISTDKRPSALCPKAHAPLVVLRECRVTYILHLRWWGVAVSGYGGTLGVRWDRPMCWPCASHTKVSVIVSERSVPVLSISCLLSTIADLAACYKL